MKLAMFDVDGTLWDNQACARYVMEVTLPKFTPPLPQEDSAEVIGEFNAATGLI